LQFDQPPEAQSKEADKESEAVSGAKLRRKEDTDIGVERVLFN